MGVSGLQVVLLHRKPGILHLVVPLSQRAPAKGQGKRQKREHTYFFTTLAYILVRVLSEEQSPSQVIRKKRDHLDLKSQTWDIRQSEDYYQQEVTPTRRPGATSSLASYSSEQEKVAGQLRHGRAAVS